MLFWLLWNNLAWFCGAAWLLRGCCTVRMYACCVSEHLDWKGEGERCWWYTRLEALCACTAPERVLIDFSNTSMHQHGKHCSCCCSVGGCTGA
jgi:hypothetical protein